MRKGVTLIELLIVMIIVAILSIVIFVSMSGNIDDAQTAALKDFQNNARTAVNSWNAAVLTKNPNAFQGNLQGAGDPMDFAPNALTGTPVGAETLRWFAFLQGSYTLNDLGGSPIVAKPLGNTWLSGMNTAGDVLSKIGPKFDSLKTVIVRDGANKGFKLVTP